MNECLILKYVDLFSDKYSHIISINFDFVSQNLS